MNEMEVQFRRETAKQYLLFFGNQKPTSHQLKAMQQLLFNVWLNRDLIVQPMLSRRERQCLYLASQGNTIEETAQLLGVSKDTVETYRRQVIKKFGCRNIQQAITLGIRYGVEGTKSHEFP